MAIKFNTTFFEAGAPKYVAGDVYPESEETLRCVAKGIAESVEYESTGEGADESKAGKKPKKAG